MRVQIRDYFVDYDSDYSRQNHAKWKVKAQDAYAFEDIDGTKVFVKRFENEPNALDLLQKLKGKKKQGIPKVYDIVKTTENRQEVYYLFTECYNGSTLKERILQNKSFDPKAVATDILQVLSTLREYDHWFSDLNEENIFCLDDGSYALIDVDSCWHNDIKPNADNNEPGGIPGAAQEFSNFALQFYREFTEASNFQYADINGAYLNYLQILGLTTKLSYYKLQRVKNPTFKYTTTNFKDLHHILISKNALYSTNLFQRALDGTLTDGMVQVMVKYLTDELKVDDTLGANAKIDFFKTAEGTQFVTNGESVTVTWGVINADEVKLFVNGQTLKVAPNGSKKFQLNKNTLFRLEAYKSHRKETDVLQVNVGQVSKPTIFYLKPEDEVYKVNKGREIQLQWSLRDATDIKINGESVGSNWTGTKTFSPQKTTTYTIIATNAEGKKDKKDITIKVKSSGAGWIWGILFLVGVFSFWQWSVQKRIHFLESKIESALKAEKFESVVDNYNYLKQANKQAVVVAKSNLKPWEGLQEKGFQVLKKLDFEEALKYYQMAHNISGLNSSFLQVKIIKKGVEFIDSLAVSKPSMSQMEDLKNQAYEIQRELDFFATKYPLQQPEFIAWAKEHLSTLSEEINEYLNKLRQENTIYAVNQSETSVWFMIGINPPNLIGDGWVKVPAGDTIKLASRVKSNRFYLRAGVTKSDGSTRWWYPKNPFDERKIFNQKNGDEALLYSSYSSGWGNHYFTSNNSSNVLIRSYKKYK